MLWYYYKDFFTENSLLFVVLSNTLALSFWIYDFKPFSDYIKQNFIARYVMQNS